MVVEKAPVMRRIWNRARIVRRLRFASVVVAAVVACVSSNTTRADSFLDLLRRELGLHPTQTPAPTQTPTPETMPTAPPAAAKNNAADQPQLTAAAQAPTAAPSIPVVLPKVETVSDTLVITGNAAAVNQVKLIARVLGYLERVNFQDGALVRKGDLLFTIQQDQYKAQLAQAEAQLQLQHAALSYARTEVVRYTALLKRDAASQVDVDHWNFEQQSAVANIAAAEAQVALARLNLGYTEVTAPFDGQMGRHLVDPGNVVGGEGQQAALAEISQLDPIYVEANLSSDQALQIRANLDQRRLTLQELHQVPVEVGLSGSTDFPLHGTVEYVSPTIDPATGTLLVRGILRNPNRTLLPGMFVRIRLPMGKVEQSAMLVPDRALQEDQGGRYLLVVGPDDVIRQRYVQIGQLVGSLRVVTSGLTRDNQVVVGELWRASPGTRVAPQLTPMSE
jgi:RND family efflux transporter MFP subunit